MMIGTALLAALFATPALAHEGAHLHPHGAEWPVWALTGATALAGALLWRARK